MFFFRSTSGAACKVFHATKVQTKMRLFVRKLRIWPKKIKSKKADAIIAFSRYRTRSSFLTSRPAWVIGVGIKRNASRTLGEIVFSFLIRFSRTLQNRYESRPNDSRYRPRYVRTDLIWSKMKLLVSVRPRLDTPQTRRSVIPFLIFSETCCEGETLFLKMFKHPLKLFKLTF